MVDFICCDGRLSGKLMWEWYEIDGLPPDNLPSKVFKNVMLDTPNGGMVTGQIDQSDDT